MRQEALLEPVAAGAALFEAELFEPESFEPEAVALEPFDASAPLPLDAALELEPVERESVR
ncbi:hypothetical protein [Agrococcus sp. TSP3-2-1]|uniref:hypothetical protein n=1 Tax=Agrococcus sp. TSP3-2-1 TaxID=2804583 RepID=UPI003CF261B2